MLVEECDYSDPQSIEKYSKKLIGKTFAQIIGEDLFKLKDGEWEQRYDELFEKVNNEFSNEKNKGRLGQIIEKYFFHYNINSNPNPDFADAKLELKTTPYKILSKGEISAKERLKIAEINYHNIINDTFYNSHLWEKANSILLIYYLYSKEIKNRLKYKIDYASIFHPPAEDLPTIIHDFEIIKKKIMEGKADELSCSDTDYLEACPSGINSEDKTSQPNSKNLAMRRAFAFKVGYMTSILRRYIVPGISTYNNCNVLPEEETTILPKGNKKPLEDYVVNKVMQYYGKTMNELKKEFDVKTNPKNLGSYLIFKILGVKGNNAAEFLKANIAVKVIRVENNGGIREHMSFPPFKFKDLVTETWDDSTFGNYLRDTRFFLVVYRKNESNEYVLKGGQFWNMPFGDLENYVRPVWEKTVEIVKDGSSFKILNGHCTSSLPKISENPVCHVRPHAIDRNDTYELPNGMVYPKQCFWLHKKYIKSQLDKEYFE